MAPLKSLEDRIISTRISMLEDFAEASCLHTNGWPVPGGRILKDIAIIEEESLSGGRRNVETWKRRFENLYGLSYRYAGKIKEADEKFCGEIVEMANIFADLQVRRGSPKHGLHVLQCRTIFDHWLTWVDQGKKPEEDLFEPASHSQEVYNDLIVDLGYRL